MFDRDRAMELAAQIIMSGQTTESDVIRLAEKMMTWVYPMYVLEDEQIRVVGGV